MRRVSMPVRAILLVVLLMVSQADYARDAIALGKTRDEALYEAFNKGYSLSTSDSIDSAEIVTEFRRAVLIVRDRAQQGELAITEHDVDTAMAPHRGKVTFIVQAHLHPLNIYAKPPSYDLYIRTGPQTDPVPPSGLKRDP